MRRRTAAILLACATALFLLSAAVLYALSPQHSAGIAAAKRLVRRTAQVATTSLRPQPTNSAAAATVETGKATAAFAGALKSPSVSLTQTYEPRTTPTTPVSSIGRRLIQAERGLHSLITQPLPAALHRTYPTPPCKDDNPKQCLSWASTGECTNNPIYMRNNCPVSCDSCADIAKRAKRCHRTLENRPLLKAGGVHATFETLLQLMAPTHEVHVLSRPPQGPWVITIEDFLAEHEIRAMIDKGGHHFERSLAGEGVSPVRTSKTSWCNVPFCESDPVIKSIKNRVANVTGVPLQNSEHVQVRVQGRRAWLVYTSSVREWHRRHVR
uniref:ShKT domain-containing protein n=1 Tax=Haptolina brevifila TaxID=156173 RepID=A0A7S2CWU7_9EUKA|mmetsp:Transcript_30109/g.60404  ORF Transcript_30109/g.60404 Transcript_30109/m.60404 type:complete len:326 (+) Transcript_30109:74-1051(+)